MATNPGVRVTVTELPTTNPASGVSEVPVVYGVAERGPVGVPILLSGDLASEYRRIFGAPVEGQSVFHSLTTLAAFGVTSAYFMRACKYDDIDGSADTEGAVAAAGIPGTGVAVRASITGSAGFAPLDLSPLANGTVLLTFEVNGGVAKDVTLVADYGEYTASVGTFTSPLPANCRFTYRVNGGASKTLDLTGMEFATGAAVAAYLNSAMQGVSVSIDAGALVFQTDRKGSSALFEITSVGAGASDIGVATTSAAGSGSVANDGAVTFAELKSLIENDVKTTTAGDLLTVDLTGSNRVRFLVVTGVAASTTLEITAAEALLQTALGIAPALAEGSSTSAGTYAVIEAAYKGTESKGSWGDRLSYKLSVQSRAPSRGAGNDFRQDVLAEDTVVLLSSTKGLRTGTVLAFIEDEAVEYRTVQSIEAVVGGTPTYRITLNEALDSGYTIAGGTALSLEYKLEVLLDGIVVETFEYLGTNSALDNYMPSVVNGASSYVAIREADDEIVPAEVVFAEALSGGVDPDVDIQVEDVLGNESFGTGLQALADVPTATKLLIPRPLAETYTNLPWGPSLDFAMSLYCEANPRLRYICATPNLPNEAAMVAYRDSTGVDSYKLYMYGPWIAVRDLTNPNPSALVVIDPSAAVVGLSNRVRGIPTEQQGGIGAAFAGDGQFGSLSPVVRGVRFSVSRSGRAAMTEAGINPIMRKTGVTNVSINVMGSRTLSSNPKRKSVSGAEVEAYLIGDYERRMTAFEFRDLDERTYSQATTAMKVPLRALHRAKRLFGAREEDAFIVVCNLTNNTDADREAKTLNGRVGFRQQNEAEFVFINIARMDAGAVVTVEE